jgi:HJR/Mrr/RecB family endonuclease
MALRKNFPSRVEARRSRAAQRSGRTASVSAPAEKGSGRAAPLVAPHTVQPSFESTLAAPAPPTLPEFGLSDEAVSRLPKPWFRVSPAGGIREFWSYLVADLSVFLLIFHTGIHFSFGWIMGLLGFSFVFVVPFMIAWAILGSLEKRLYRAVSENYARYHRYQAAVAAYQVRLTAFEKSEQEREAHLAKQRADYWRGLSGTAFEIELGELFSRMGYEVAYTPSTSDGGVDICLRKDERFTIVQCKAHNKPVSISVARELSACIVDFRAHDAIIACFEGVTKPVTEYIRTKPITVLTLTEIVAYQKQYG